MSSHFYKILLIRFFSYFFILTGITSLLLTIEPVMGEEVRFQTNQILGRSFSVPNIIRSQNQEDPGQVFRQAQDTEQGRSARMTEDGSGQDSGQVFRQAQDTEQGRSARMTPGFGSLLFGGSEVITPVSTDFGIVIEKINANALVVPNVDPSDEKAYTEALGRGVAHAKGTVFPGQTGNIYLFSHSTDAPWNIVRYNAIFYLLGKLEVGDRVVMFYQGRRFDYIVFDKQIVKPEDTHFLTDTYNKSVLTLQTCDPPGTLINRMIIRAKLVGE